MRKMIVAAGLAFATGAFAQNQPLTPGARTLMLAHNAYPDHGKYADRLDRALASGQPFVVEEDLAWIYGQSLLIHSQAPSPRWGAPTHVDRHYIPCYPKSSHG